MTTDLRVELIEDASGLVLRKTASSPAAAAHLAREAQRLRQARHRGVVALVDATDDHLDIEWAGADTLALARLTRGAAVRVVASVAATVADLHHLGIVHGRIDESHVVIGPDGQPRLCGMRGVAPGGAEPGPADDVADLGRLLEQLLGIGADAELFPDHRWRTRHRSAARDRTLDLLAQRAADPDPARRPTARALAQALAELAPPSRPGPAGEDDASPTAERSPAHQIDQPAAAIEEPSTEDASASRPEIPPTPVPDGGAGGASPARVPSARLMARSPSVAATGARPVPPSTPRPDLDSDPSSDAGQVPDPDPFGVGPSRDAAQVSAATTPRRWAALRPLGAIAVVALVLTALVSHQQARSPQHGDWSAADPAATASIVQDARSTTSAPDDPATTASQAYAVAGSAVTSGGRSYQVGSGSDHVAVADWDCDGEATAGLVRPSTGEVFLFDGWPDDGPITVEARTSVAGADQLVGTPPGPDCTPAAVRLTDGSISPLPPGVTP